MDDTLKVPSELPTDLPASAPQSLARTPTTDVSKPQQPDGLDTTIQIKALVREALAEDINLARLREINVLVTSLLSAQLSAPPPAQGVSSESANAMRQLLRQIALDSYREEYKEISDVWKALEAKAQGTVTIAGIFVAAAFTFAKDLAASRLDFYGNLCLGAAIMLLIPTIICSILVLWKRTVKSIPSGEAIESWADAIAEATDDDLPDRIRRLLDQQSAVWKETVASAKDAIDKKAQLLHTAQVLLVFAIGAAAIVTLRLLKV